MGRLFDPPTVAIASADDAWFSRFKEIIGEFHWTPREALALADARAAREANRRESRTPRTSRPLHKARFFSDAPSGLLCPRWAGWPDRRTPSSEGARNYLNRPKMALH